VTAKDGEIAHLVKAYDCGIVVEPGNSLEMTRAIVQLSTDSTTAAAMGRRARTMLEAKFTRRHAFKRWEQTIDRVA
jgi:glycosyltransferase involved in cell wall biosynthesis